MLSFDDDDVCEYGPQHSTPIKANAVIMGPSDEQQGRVHPSKVTGGSSDRHYKDKIAQTKSSSLENIQPVDINAIELFETSVSLSDTTVDISKISVIETTPTVTQNHCSNLQCTCLLSSHKNSVANTSQTNDATIHNSPHSFDETLYNLCIEQPSKPHKPEQVSGHRVSPSCVEHTSSVAATHSCKGKQKHDSSHLFSSNARNLTSGCTSDSDQPQSRPMPETRLQNVGSVDIPEASEQRSSPQLDREKTFRRMRPSSAPRSQLHMNTCNHSNDPQYPSYSFTEFSKVPAAYIEQDIINKQRHEIQLLMEELGTRDQELNDLVLSHQKQIKAWESDCEKLSALQERVTQYEDELKSREEQLQETLLEMSKVNEQRDVDARELEGTKDEMVKLAERIMENSLYIQEMEAQNQKLSVSLKELVNVRNAFNEREQELMSLMDKKDYQLSDKQQEVDKLMEHIKFLECRCEELEEKNANLTTESSAWKKKYCLAKDETDRLTNECRVKEENIHKMTQQLHESLQQAIALQKALFTSCEREKCKEEVMYSLRKQHKRTMQELQNIRELYDRQNRDAPLYHLSVKEQDGNNGKRDDDNADEWKKKKDGNQQRREDEKGKPSRHDRNMSFHVLRPADTGKKDSAVGLSVKENQDRKAGDKAEENSSENLGQGDRSFSAGQKPKGNEDVAKIHIPQSSLRSQKGVKNEQLSSTAIRASHTVMCRNARIITSGSSVMTEDISHVRQPSQCQRRMPGRIQNPQEIVYMQESAVLIPEESVVLVPEEPMYESQSECHPCPHQKKSTRSRSTSPIVTWEGPNSGKHKRIDQFISSPSHKRVKDHSHHVRYESSSDVSHIASLPKFDEELTPADSDGMCHELQRVKSSFGTECREDIFTSQDISTAPKTPPVEVKLYQSLPQPKKSSFLKKEKVERKLSCSPIKEPPVSPNSRNKKRNGVSDSKREQKLAVQQQDGKRHNTVCSPIPKSSEPLERKNSAIEKESPTSVSQRKPLSSRENVRMDRGNGIATDVKQSPQCKKMDCSTEKESPQSRQREGQKQINEQSVYESCHPHHHAIQAAGSDMADSKSETDGICPQQSQAAQSRFSLSNVEKLLGYNNSLGNPNKYSSCLSNEQVSCGENPSSVRGPPFEIDPIFVHHIAVRDALAQPNMCINKKIQLPISGFDHCLQHWGGISIAPPTVDNLPEDVSVYLARQWPLRSNPNLYFNNNQSGDGQSEPEAEKKGEKSGEKNQKHPLKSHDVSEQYKTRNCQIRGGDGYVQKTERKKSPVKCVEDYVGQKDFNDSWDSGGQKQSDSKRRYIKRSRQQSDNHEMKCQSSGKDCPRTKECSDLRDPSLLTASDMKLENKTRPRTEITEYPDSAKVDHFLQEKTEKLRQSSKGMKQQAVKFHSEVPSDGSSEGNAKDGRPYFYVEAAESKTDAIGEEDSKPVKREGQEVKDVPVIAPIPSKPFTSTKGPSLYKHLSQIHFSEKTGRYEWVSRPVFTTSDGKVREANADKSANCAPDQEKCGNNLLRAKSVDEQDSGQIKTKSDHGRDSGQYKHHNHFCDSDHHIVTENIHFARHEGRSLDRFGDKQGKSYSSHHSAYDATADNKVDERHRHSQSPGRTHERSSRRISNPVSCKSNNNSNSDGSFALDHSPSTTGQLDKSSNNNSTRLPACQSCLPCEANLDECCLRSCLSHQPSHNLDPVVKRLNFDDTDFDETVDEAEQSGNNLHQQGMTNASCSDGLQNSDQDTGICNSGYSQTPVDTEKTENLPSAIKDDEKEADSDYETKTTNDVESQELVNSFTSTTPLPRTESTSSQNFGRCEKDLRISGKASEHCSTTHHQQGFIPVCTCTFLDKDQICQKSKSPNNSCLAHAEPEQYRSADCQSVDERSSIQPDSNICIAVTEERTHPGPITDGDIEAELDTVGCESAQSGRSECHSSPHCWPRSLPEYFQDISTLLVSPEEEDELFEIIDHDQSQDHGVQSQMESVKIEDVDKKADDHDRIPQKDLVTGKTSVMADKLCHELLEGQLISPYWMKANNCDKNLPVYYTDSESKSVINKPVNPSADSYVKCIIPDKVACVHHLNIASQIPPESLLENTRDSNTSTLSQHSSVSAAKTPAWVYQGSYEEAADQFNEKLSSFLEDPEEERSMQAVPMSPATKLYRLLVQSQEMIRSLEKSSAIPAGIESKAVMPSTQ